MRSDGRHAAAHIICPRFRQRGCEASLSPARFVAQLDARRSISELLVGVDDERAETSDENGSGLAEPIADVRHLRVPHVEGERGFVVETTADLLQQSVALLQDPIELETRL